MTTTIKRIAHDNNQDYDSSNALKMPKYSHSIASERRRRPSISSEESQEQSVLSTTLLSTQCQQQEPGLLDDALISQLLNNSRSQQM